MAAPPSAEPIPPDNGSMREMGTFRIIFSNGDITFFYVAPLRAGAVFRQRIASELRSLRACRPPPLPRRLSHETVRSVSLDDDRSGRLWGSLVPGGQRAAGI